ncbi:LLM class flavin-dependent oxidoreductase [Mycobacterium intracellulare]|uniref:LLM class flavin-dependent oxidoreductase n=1 Tax=Mycobacterium intracellulare TaxID=1767 RepID=UPI00080B2901|nr:LLM class flavin-dependent oxidoreductase [Mycobacterium intracellulare]OCB27237.1 hypothetical protein A5689_09870 [Mycobacterium intracellulare subsp. yongonense]
MRFGICLQALNSADWKRVIAKDWSQPPLVPDHVLWEENIHLGLLAEPLGFDSMWTTEHHFGPHCMEPNPLELLAYFAGATKTIDFGTMVIVLPWHHPLQVAEEIALFDILLQGRKLSVGVGRGLGQSEFAGFGIDMAESRGRFVESIDILKLALTQERFSYDGEFYQIPETSTRPRPRSDRLIEDMLGVFTSPQSLTTVAEAGLNPMFVAAQSADVIRNQVAEFNGLRSGLGLPAAQPIVHQWVYCTETEEEARTMGKRYITQLGVETNHHYNLGDAAHWDGIKGYEYQLEQAKNGLIGNMDLHLVGTPEQCIERVQRLREITNCREIVGLFHFGGMSIETAEKSMRLFAEGVMPTIRAMDAEPRAAATA